MKKNEKLHGIIDESDKDDQMKQKLLALDEENSSEEARDIFAALNSKVFFCRSAACFFVMIDWLID